MKMVASNSHERVFIHFNPLYTGGIFHCQKLNDSICHFRGVAFILFLMENPVSK